jgi:Fe-S cluster biogenesis protein NfuA
MHGLISQFVATLFSTCLMLHLIIMLDCGSGQLKVHRAAPPQRRVVVVALHGACDGTRFRGVTTDATAAG